jgi:hypothetical protein
MMAVGTPPPARPSETTISSTVVFSNTLPPDRSNPATSASRNRAVPPSGRESHPAEDHHRNSVGVSAGSSRRKSARSRGLLNDQFGIAHDAPSRNRHEKFLSDAAPMAGK